MARSASSWRPTPSHLRALLVAAVTVVASLVLHRPAVLVLGVPFAVVALWASLTRPVRPPDVSARVAHTTLREGEATTWHGQLRPVAGLEEVAAVLEAPPWSRLDPPTGVRALAVPRDGAAPVSLSIAWRSLRWGRRSLGPGLIGCYSSWGAFRYGPVELEPIRTTTLPLPAVFDTAAPAPHPRGLVGVNRAASPGEGSEFASIRPFQVGDRLRRVHWPVSTRTGELHVTSSYADQDSHVVLVVDAFNDLGESEGIEGTASTLDVTVRAAGAVAEHYLHRGERVSLRVLGAADVTRVPPAAGARHLRRVLDSLAAIRPGTDRDPDERVTHLGIGAGALVVMLSPLVSPVALQHAVTLARRGLTVVVIDSLPEGLAAPGDGAYASLAWRLRLLERDREIRRIERAGVPVVAWGGPGSLDQVLRELSRRAAGPRRAHA